MIACILTGHGAFADGLASALEMVAGPQDDFSRVTFFDDEAATFSERLASEISRLSKKCGEVLVFCDLLGGTPSNQALMLAATTPGVHVITGTNLPMLLECMSARNDSATAEELVATAVEIGRMGVDHPVLELSACEETETGDGI